MITVYIVGYEPKENCNGSGGFNWWITEKLAEKDFFDLHKSFITSDEYNIYRGSIEVDVPIFEELTEDLRENITTKVESFLELNDWENSFK